MQVERLKINERTVEVRRRPRQRHLRLRVTPHGVLRVTCSLKIPHREILQFIESNEPFVLEQLERFRELRAQFPEKQFVEGESLPFIGQQKTLQIFKATGKQKVFINGTLIFLAEVPTRAEKLDLIRKFYRRCAGKYLQARLTYCSARMQLFPTSLSFRCQSSRWGSCSSAGHVSLNWRLIAAPAEVIDYVIIHELAHLQHHDHSPQFWKLVEQFSPRYKLLKSWLNENQWAFDFLAKTP